jgi:hypothetical protein
MSAYGTSRTFRNVRFLVAIRCKPDIGQAASRTLYFMSTRPSSSFLTSNINPYFGVSAAFSSSPNTGMPNRFRPPGGGGPALPGAANTLKRLLAATLALQTSTVCRARGALSGCHW